MEEASHERILMTVGVFVSQQAFDVGLGGVEHQSGVGAAQFLFTLALPSLHCSF